MKGGELLAQLAAHLRADGNVESRQRLVQQKELRLGRERAQKGDALRLAAGQRSGQSVRSISKAGFVEPPTSDGGRVRPALRAQAEGDVLDCAQVRKEDMVLEHEAGSPALRGYVQPTCAVVQDLAIKNHSACHLIQTGECPQKRRLSAPVGTKHGHRLVRGRRQGDIEREGVSRYAHHSLERHSAPSQRSRMPTRIATETTSRM